MEWIQSFGLLCFVGFAAYRMVVRRRHLRELPRRAKKRSSRVFVAASRCRPPVWPRLRLWMFVKRRGMLLQRPSCLRPASPCRLGASRAQAPGLPFRAPVEGLPPAARVCARQCGLRAGIPALAGWSERRRETQRLDFVCCDEGATPRVVIDLIRDTDEPAAWKFKRERLEAEGLSYLRWDPSGCRRARGSGCRLLALLDGKA